MIDVDIGSWGFIGLDPGITCGIAWATVDQFAATGYAKGKQNWNTSAASSNYDGWRFILSAVLIDFGNRGLPVLVSGEKFLTGNRAGSKGENADLTREYLFNGLRLAKEMGASVSVRTAAEVKPWATDRRLEKIKFPLAPKMKDARDAGRHMLFGACKVRHITDPLA